MNFNLNLLAQIVGANFGINVVPGSGFAIGKTESGLVLYVPPLAVGDDDDAMIVRSGLCHEAVGHGRHTDFDAKRGPTPLHLAIENVLEDARIEKAAWKIYPKTRRILGEGMSVMHKRNMLKRASNQSTPAEKAAIAVLLRLLVAELGYCTGDLDWKVDWTEAVSCFGDEIMNKVWAEAVAGYQVASTAEVITVAARIVKLLSQGFEDQQQPRKGQGKSDPSDSGDQSQSGSGSGESQSDDQGQGQNGDSSKGDEDQDGNGKEGDKADGDDPAQSGGKDGQGGKPDADGGGSGDGQTRKGGNDATGDQPGNGKGGGSSHAPQEPVPLDRSAIKPEEFDRGDIVKKQIDNRAALRAPQISVTSRKPTTSFTPPVQGKAAAQRLKSALAQRLQAIVEDEEDSLVESGILASNRLVDARMGDRFVFAEPGKPGERLDTAFSLLIDMSGSMNGISDAACLSATWAIGDTLNGYGGMGIAFSVSAFNGSLLTLKDWNEPWKRGDVLTPYCAGGSTYTYGAVENRLSHLLKRHEPRKVLYLITDGDIGDLSSLVNSAKEMDTEIVVMMIGDPSRKPDAPYLKRFSVIGPDKIATEMLKTVTSLF